MGHKKAAGLLSGAGSGLEWIWQPYLLFCSDILDLVDNLLILALGLEVEVDASDGANDTTDAAT